MITIPITLIGAIFGTALLGAFFGVFFTAVFAFGCDEKYLKQNALIGAVVALTVVAGRVLTDVGVIVWK